MTSIRRLEQSLRAVSNARRLGILTYLKQQKSATVNEIAAAVRLKSTSASQHLRILKAAQIVEHKKRGLYVTYRLSLKQTEPVKTVIGLL